MSQIKLKRGYKEHLPSSLPLGEPAICLDTQEMYVGNGMGKNLLKINGLELDEIHAQIENLTNIVSPFTVSNFTANPSTVEMGDVRDITLAWSYSREIASQSLNGSNIDKTLRSTVKNGISNSTSFTIKGVTPNNLTASKSVNVNFLNGVYYGVSSSSSYDNNLVSSLTKTLSNTRGRTITVNCGSGQHIFYCLPSRLGACSFSVGGFDGGFDKVATINFRNSFGYSENYDIYKSSNSGLGNTTVVIK